MLWAVGMVIALGAIGVLVAKRYPSIWDAVSREQVATLIGIGVALTVIIVLLALIVGGASLKWTGFGDKTLWDWLQLLSSLAIPVVLTVAGFWFAAQQDKREAERAERAQAIEDQRADDAALQAYLDQMSTLLLKEKDLKNDRVRTVMRARTVTLLSRLDGSRQGSVLRFLSDAGLINRGNPIISLGETRRSKSMDDRFRATGLGEYALTIGSVKLDKVNLTGADLSGTDLSHLNLGFAKLSGADLTEANLSGSILTGADLVGADLRGATLYLADLKWANKAPGKPTGAEGARFTDDSA